jgi:hypothetical protein
MTSRAIEPVPPTDDRGAQTGHVPTLPVAPAASSKGSGKSTVATAAPTRKRAREAARTETLRLLGKVEEHVGRLRRALERPTRGTKSPAGDRPRPGPLARP